MAPMTLLPVMTIQAKQIDARLLGGTARLMTDVVTPNAAAVAAHPSAVDLKAKFERAARYAVGNTVVCDSLDEVRRLCFDDSASAASAGSAAAASAPPPGPRIKAVDLEGTKIDKSGVMTGGTMHSLANRAGRWSEAQFEAVRKERTEAERELRSLPTAEQQKAAQDDLARRAASIQQQLGYAEKDLAEATKTLETLEREAATLEEEKKRTAAQTEKHAAEYAKVASEVSGKETKLRAELDDVFGDFSRRVGVANIAEFEEKHFSQVQQVAAQRSKLTKQEAVLQTQIEYERKRGLAKKMEDQRAKLQADKKEEDKLREKVENVEKTEQKHEAEQNELSKKLLALGKETAALDAEIAETKKQLAAEQAKLAGINRSITNMQTRGEKIAMKVPNVLENCEMESVELPWRGRVGRRWHEARCEARATRCSCRCR
ncbi:structural maintenance of chromosomes protein [Pseudoscourfieldia marina]